MTAPATSGAGDRPARASQSARSARAARARALGRRGEDAAAAWYEERSYRILARNWRGTDGEIDLVLRGPAGEVVFCEVKTRASGRFGTPLDAVTPAKQRRLRHLAAEWLRRGRAAGASGRVRFDVASVGPAPGGALRVEVLEDAF